MLDQIRGQHGAFAHRLARQIARQSMYEDPRARRLAATVLIWKNRMSSR
jgi:hypothetical protein